jgi:DNA repair protein RecN (Recombination protein N)
MVLSFYGQHEHRKLTLAAAQLQILDGLCGADQAARLSACAGAFRRTRELEQKLERLEELSAQREREVGLLEFELREIDALAPDEDEREQLLAARERLRRSDALQAAAGAGAEALAPENSEIPGVTQQLAHAVSALDAIAGVDPDLDRLAARLAAGLLEAQDLAGELRNYCERGLDGPGSLDLAGVEPTLESVEERLQGLERLIRKHGGSIASVIDYAEQARARLEELNGAEVALADTTAELAAARAELDAAAGGLREARRAAAAGFAAAVRAQLETLAMGEASFEAALGETEAGPSGADTVEFTIAPNPGVPAGPLREIASGGELSRVMLAIMSAASAAAQGTTLVFDEVDAGIGGRTANAVGARLRELGERGQVLCITHLPQIASLGTRHFSIVKDTHAEPTRTTVVQLDERQVVSELVRMLGAESDDTTARRHARDLRRAA